MNTITIPGWKSFQYREVFLITKRKSGAIFKTKSTGKFVPENTRYNRNKYILASLNTTLSKSNQITLELYDQDLT